MAAYINSNPENCKLIIAPHEISVANIVRIKQAFDSTFLYSECKLAFGVAPYLDNKIQSAGTTAGERASKLQDQFNQARVLIIDNVGMLSRLYKYAAICYIGGGFTKSGIHNILEAAVYGKPVLFGPNYKKYREAVELIKAGGGFSIATAKELKEAFERLFHNQQQYAVVSHAAATYVQNNKGATEAIVQYIQEKRLLTS